MEQEKPAIYVVDAESAYRFSPVQYADCWLQCFVWWGPDGRAGVAVDRRLGFGGRLRAKQIRTHFHARGGAPSGGASTVRRGTPAAGG
eukprot:4655673-Pleurochrysis_carterae.AAC.1